MANAGYAALSELRAPGVTIHMARPLDVPVSDGTSAGDRARDAEIEKRIRGAALGVSKNAGEISRYAMVAAIAHVRDDTVRGILGEPYYLSALKQGIAETAKEDADVHKFVTSMIADRYVSMMKARRETEKEKKQLETQIAEIVSEWENIVAFLREHPDHHDQARLRNRVFELAEEHTHLIHLLERINNYKFVDGEFRYMEENQRHHHFGGRRRRRFTKRR